MKVYTVYWSNLDRGVLLGRSGLTAEHLHDAMSALTRLSVPNSATMLTLVEGHEIISLEPLTSAPEPSTSVITQAEQPLQHHEAKE